jgi:NAD+ synthase (glutamine-hydrolysing)
MRIGLGQIDPLIGDFSGNCRKIVEFARAANGEAVVGVRRAGRKGGCDLLVFPELALCGYPPMDLLDQASFAYENQKALRFLQRSLPQEMAVAVGHVERNYDTAGKPYRNVVSILHRGAVVFSQAKTLLPTYDVFDEARYFEPAKSWAVFEFKGEKIGIAICEDLWGETLAGRYQEDPVSRLLDSGASLILAASASPFHAGKLDIRTQLAARVARTGGLPVVYVNSIGANDSLIFDGRSFALDPAGEPIGMAGWEEELLVLDIPDAQGDSIVSCADIVKLQGADGPRAAAREAAAPPEAGRSDRKYDEYERALVLGIRGYMRKCGFGKAHLGLSGGIDSALVAVLAAKAIGPENLTCISLPSRYSSDHSKSDARALAEALGCGYEVLPIEGPFASSLEALAPLFAGKAADITEENLQARIRGMLLMAYSNKHGSMLLTTGNKSEIAAGYCTLYGDMCGALAVIGDLYKTEVYGLCRFINSRGPLIPESSLTKPPSAELRPGQVDQDSLPPYEVLDAILERYIEGNMGLEEISALGFEPELVKRVITMVAKAEYKRRQAAPVLKVSPRAFGTGRRIPIARKIHEA